jgi:hypothetical protein
MPALPPITMTVCPDSSGSPLLAASIFLDVLNVFLFFLDTFSGGGR